MTLKVLLTSDGPGYGTLMISGGDVMPDTAEIALQRNRDDKYLGQNRHWHTTPYWHSPDRMERADAELRLRLGPEIIDGVVACSNMALRVWMRTDAGEDQGVLRIRGQLLGSSAASEVTLAINTEDTQAEEHEEEDMGKWLEQEASDLERELREQAAAENRRRYAEQQARLARRARLVRTSLVLLVCLLLAGGIAAWQLGWLDRFWAAPSPAPVAVTQSPPAPVAPVERALPVEPPAEDVRSAPEPESAAALRGRRFVQSYLGGDPKPTPEQMLAQAQQREQDQDCDAAMILYNLAANAAADPALVLARRYDPDTFQAGACLKSADADTASHWYEGPASAGNTEAQRQLGKILTSRHDSGAIYERGIEWLRQAAEAGDERAKALLAEIKKP